LLRTELLETFEELPPELRPPLLKVIKATNRLSLKAVVADLSQAQRKTGQHHINGAEKRWRRF
jgi:hypothetical protein